MDAQLEYKLPTVPKNFRAREVKTPLFEDKSDKKNFWQKLFINYK